MFRVTVLCQGRLKESWYIDACREYLKRLGAWCRAEVVELAENADMLPRIPKGAYVVALCIEGTALSSTALAERLAALANRDVSHVCFLIGGSDGLSEAMKRRADFHLSMSEMTFPHHLARVMLLEQLYRAFSINAGTKYHK